MSFIFNNDEDFTEHYKNIDRWPASTIVKFLNLKMSKKIQITKLGVPNKLYKDFLDQVGCKVNTNSKNEVYIYFLGHVTLIPINNWYFKILEKV